jgi:hypothetical protein
MTDYKSCSEIVQLTPTMIREWKNEIKGDVFLVRRQCGYFCPLREKLVSEKLCRNCVHNFGSIESHQIYCVPYTEKQVSARSMRRKK